MLIFAFIDGLFFLAALLDKPMVLAGIGSVVTLLLNQCFAERRQRILWEQARKERAELRESVERVETKTNETGRVLTAHADLTEKKLDTIEIKSDAAYEKANHFNEKIESLTALAVVERP